jgi:hypothetical protein
MSLIFEMRLNLNQREMLKIKFAPEVFARPHLMDDPISLHGLDLPPFSPYFPISQIFDNNPIIW